MLGSIIGLIKAILLLLKRERGRTLKMISKKCRTVDHVDRS
jgi:hypothetical protein